MISRVLILLGLTTFSVMADFNTLVLEQIRTMPSGGGYATDLAAHAGLAASVAPGPRVDIDPTKAMPGYCSGGTYLVFLKTLAALEKKGALSLNAATWEALRPRLRPDGKDTLPDGEGIWGRWNANGPGTARLFFKLGLGRNFTDFSQARAGDFLKIFWTDAVGKKERGHSVVYLGEETMNGGDMIRYWSSNQPDGMGERSVPRAKIVHAIFSRLEHPEILQAVDRLPTRDSYLAGLLKTESNFSEACRKAGIRSEPPG